ncbi:glycosyltransferase [Acidisphaera sp. S103]|uniref:glycosyltransferase n=1 Tax=Acidisphaera sp. S103 TaxID=1747223 RepID=UPI00131CEC04|nr:glycosyltransferase [Acidisphaera sp. S103]
MTVRSVVVLNDFCHVQGGASRVAIDEAVALRQSGLDVTFIGAVGPVCEALDAAGVRTICLNQPELAHVAQHPLVALQTLWNRTACRALQSLMPALDPRQSIVHLHGYTKALTTAPALIANRAGLPVICTLHDFFAACPNGAFFDYRRQEPCRLRALSKSCAFTACDKRHPMHKAYRVVRGIGQRHIAHFPKSVRDYITLSGQSTDLLRPYLPPDARFHPLANIIDVQRSPKVDVGANRTLLVVGRLDAEKGVLLAAEAARRTGLPIVFAGDGPLRSAIEATGARVTGWLTPEGVRHEMDQARCLIFPSLWYETFGLVVTEAAARGVPAIVSDIAAPAERIVDGSTGWVFRSGDLDSLMRCVQFTRDSDTVQAVGTAAYNAYWAKPSDPRRHTAALTAIYDAVIADNAPTGGQPHSALHVASNCSSVMSRH